ncbi:hypothetical protein D6D85_08440 [Candidatus Methanodesulfokora washburnensis]|uniref:Uncharacterized protein n=3 Tax=Candidatus Methanodesulfokora washburnensis TaxID=2478471 RepID=A0A3R9PVL3_9CREN|nr:hypothetical protein D6D85_08440 [Candidatus Methanodesulfokores washburnensis]
MAFLIETPYYPSSTFVHFLFINSFLCFNSIKKYFYARKKKTFAKVLLRNKRKKQRHKVYIDHQRKFYDTMRRSLLVSATDYDDSTIEAILKLVKPDLICFIGDDFRRTFGNDLIEKMNWMTGGNVVWIDSDLADVHAVMDAVDEAVGRASAEEVDEVYVNVTPGRSLASIALYTKACLRGFVAVAEVDGRAIRVPIVPYNSLPWQALEILRVLHEDFDGRASLADLSGRVNLGGEEGRSKIALTDYYINKYLKGKYVSVELVEKKLYVNITEVGESIARRYSDFMSYEERMPLKKKMKKKIVEKIVGDKS